MKVFTLIFAVLLVGTNSYTRSEYALDNTYLLFKVQLPICDSSEITAGGPEITACTVVQAVV